MNYLSRLCLFVFLCLHSVAFAQAEEEIAMPRDQGLVQTIVMISIAMVFFYFILWRPEQKRRKEMEEKRESLRKGDRVTAMGILGTVVKVEEHTVVLRLYDGAKMEMLRAAITDVASSDGQEDSKEGSSKRVELKASTDKE